MSSKKIKPKKRFKPSSLILFTGSLALVICIGAIAWQNIKSRVDYQKTVTVYNSDNKFQIDVPQQMAVSQKSINIIDYQDTQSDDSKELISHMRVESQFVGKDRIKETKDTITKQLKEKNGSYFETFKQKAQNSPSATNVYFGDFRDYKSPYAGDALLADFGYKYDSVKVSGGIMVAFSEDSVYIVVIEATEDVWKENQNTWDKMLSSFRFN